MNNELNRRNAERHGASDKVLPRLTERGFLTKASERRHDHLVAEAESPLDDTSTID